MEANHTSSSLPTVSVSMSESIKVKGTTLALILLGMSALLSLIFYRCVRRRRRDENDTDVVECRADNNC
ncbi:hypothetical protein V6N12_061619 [Hibiscus sabdariffa]|uniref:Uncharacterized protein n=1 Tax=Hibiscus sabdariffa TaxID=183260 RepID=A0ABR2DXK8_9ROSI